MKLSLVLLLGALSQVSFASGLIAPSAGTVTSVPMVSVDTDDLALCSAKLQTVQDTLSKAKLLVLQVQPCQMREDGVGDGEGMFKIVKHAVGSVSFLK